MIISRTGFKENHKIQVIIAVVLMLISMYVPYHRILSYIFQISVLVILLVLFRASSYAYIPILLLTTTRSYIAVSTHNEFVEYLGLNSEILSLFIILILFLALRMNNFKIPYDSGLVSIILFALLMILSKVWAVNSLEYNSLFIPICLIYICFPLLIKSETDIIVVKYSFTLSGFFGALGIIPHMVINGNIYQSAVSVDRNYQSCFFLICLLQTITLMLNKNIKLKLHQILICWLIIFMDIYIILSSASRSGFLSLVIAAATIILLNIKRFKKSLSALIFTIIGLLFLNELKVFNFVLSRFDLSNAQTGNGREQIWISYLNGYSRGNPFDIIFGRGLVGQSIIGRPAHNIFISVLYSFGFLGILLLLFVIFHCIYQLIKSDNSIELISLVPILFICCTIEPYYRIEFAVYLSFIVGSVKYYTRRLCYE